MLDLGQIRAATGAKLDVWVSIAASPNPDHAHEDQGRFANPDAIAVILL